MGNMKIKIKSFLKRKDADDNVKSWVRWYSRIGFTAKGSVYILIGLISICVINHVIYPIKPSTTNHNTTSPNGNIKVSDK